MATMNESFLRQLALALVIIILVVILIRML